MTIADQAKIEIVEEKVLSNGWTKLSTFDVAYTSSKGHTDRLKREIYHRTPAAAVFLYDPTRDIVVLVRQFRLPVYLHEKPGFTLEAPAGLLDEDAPEEAIRREVLEETGYRARDVRFLFRVYSSPGAVTETIHLFAALVEPSDRVAAGGGLADEHEDIEVVEMSLQEALDMIDSGEIIDAKTIILLQWAMLNRDRLYS